MRGSTEFVLRHRRIVLVTWILVAVAGMAATINVGSLLTNRFSVPGSEAERGRTLLTHDFHERSEGAFTFYRPQLQMLVTGFSASRDEYGASVQWQMDLEEV